MVKEIWYLLKRHGYMNMFVKKRKAIEERGQPAFMDSPRRQKPLPPRTLVTAGLAFLLTAAVLLVLLNPSALVIASVTRADALQATSLLSASLTQKRFTYVDFLEHEALDTGVVPTARNPVVRTLSPVIDLPADAHGIKKQAVEVLFNESAEYVVTADAGFYNLTASFSYGMV